MPEKASSAARVTVLKGNAAASRGSDATDAPPEAVATGHDATIGPTDIGQPAPVANATGSRPDSVGSYRMPEELRKSFDLGMRKIKECEAQKVGVNELCWSGLASIYHVGLSQHWTEENLKAFCQARQISYTPRTFQNKFLPLVKVAYQAASCAIDNKDASRFARALKQMAGAQVPPAQAFDHLKKAGGVNGITRPRLAPARSSPAQISTMSAGVPDTLPEPQGNDVLTAVERDVLEELSKPRNCIVLYRATFDDTGLQSFNLVTEDADGNDAASNAHSSEMRQEAA
jgi:hypothetical protein